MFAAGLLALPLISADAAARSAAAFAPTRFSVRVAGSGPDVILIPGLAGSRAIWSPTVAGLPGYRYHLLQLAGFAGEPAGANARGSVTAGVAEQLARYIASRGLRRPAVIGHSMGGVIAMRLAARAPEQVGRIMVVDMVPRPSTLVGSDPTHMRGLADGLRDIARAPGGRELVASLIGLFGAPQDPAVLSDPDVVAAAMHELATLDLTPLLPTIAVPMTVVYAVPGPAQRTAIARLFAAAYRSRPATRLVRVEPSGHAIMADQPARFRAVLETFLKG